MGLSEDSEVDWPPADRVRSIAYAARALSREPEAVEVDATVPPELADHDITIPGDVARMVASAERSLARLSASEATVSVDVLAAVTSSLLRTESLSSSRIEGLEVTNRRLAEALYDPGAARRMALEVANNAAAQRRAIDLGRRRQPLTTRDISALHRLLMERVPGIRGGEFRTEQSWIGRTDDPMAADYVPPPFAEIDRLLDDLCRFIARADLPRTLHAAIAHAQFEAIHPFVDGNGRVGRCLIAVVLSRDTSSDLIPPVSGVCLANIEHYFTSLRRFQQCADPWPWVVQFCEAVDTSVDLSERLAREIVELQEAWIERAGDPRAGSITRRLIALLPIMSVTDAAAVAGRLHVDPNVARRGLNQLTEVGILTTVAGRRRNRVWRADDLHRLLDRYSAGLRRLPAD